jgi:hypothetical protein
MKKKVIGFWVATALICLLMAFGGVMDLMRGEEVMKGIADLGYPAYFPLIIGVWKLLGVAALLAPRMPLLKEWAYAGMFFDMTGASISHFAHGDGVDKWLPPLVFTGILYASWALRDPSRKVSAAAASAGQASNVARAA